MVTRALTYRPGEHGREKGVDVALAVDFVTAAVEGAYDIGVIASGDTDLLPAVEYGRRKKIAVETVAWYHDPPRGLTLPDGSVWCHRLTKPYYNQVADPTDYSVPTAK